MNMNAVHYALLLLVIACRVSYAQDVVLSSPDEQTQVTISGGAQLTYTVSYRGDTLLSASPISLTIDGNQTFGRNAEITGNQKVEVDTTIQAIVPEKNRLIPDYYRQVTVSFSQPFSLIFRAYNGGVAYRLATDIDREIKVYDEQATFNFPGNPEVIFPEEESVVTHSERLYRRVKLRDIQDEQFASLPLVVATESGTNVLLTESDLQNYAGMFLQGNQGQGLRGKFPHYVLAAAVPDTVAANATVGDNRNYYPTERADYLAVTPGQRRYPWRVMVIADSDAELVESQLVYQLAEPSRISDPSWITPGKVAWDWYNANNIFGVPFHSGVNTATYKYYIDFASENNLAYVILDEGWYELGDLTRIVPEIDMDTLLAYAEQKDVRLVPWVIWKTLDEQLDTAMAMFDRWNVAGIKVDFMQRDDQEIVNFYWRIAEAAAQQQMFVDFHGSYSPKGLRRTYPNCLSREGVKGAENNKWSRDITPEHNVTLPFVRMVAGPMDYTPGALANAQPENFAISFDRPMSQGTRMHQLAMYVVYESPLQMLCENPSRYCQEPEVMQLLSAVPTVWDTTVVIDGKIGDYILLARQRGEEWYVGAMTDSVARDFKVDLSFLGEGAYQAEIYADGVNADRYAEDFRTETTTVSQDKTLTVKLAPGGGYVARLRKE